MVDITASTTGALFHEISDLTKFLTESLKPHYYVSPVIVINSARLIEFCDCN